jgi:hypothetical protein
MSDKKEQKDPLFDNPVFTNMKKSLPKKEQERYDKIGKEMYEDIDYEKGSVPGAIDALAQIKVMLDSGMHPSYLTYEEKTFLENYLGKEWYKNFGYLENDLNRINM